MAAADDRHGARSLGADRAAVKAQHRVLFCLDEFAVLGHMQPIERAAGQIAGFGVKLWPVIQDLTQLQRDYQKAWETFMGNAGLLTFFGNTDLTTLEHISKRLGKPKSSARSRTKRKAGSHRPGEASRGLSNACKVRAEAVSPKARRKAAGGSRMKA